MSAVAATSPTTAAATSELQSSLRELHIGEKTSSITDIPRPKLTTSSALPAKKKKAPVVADSWEDDLSDQDADSDRAGDELESPNVAASLVTSPAIAEGPLDPPPTPISPQLSQPWIASAATVAGGYGQPTSTSTSARDPNRRPEKQTAVAGRLIAGALGIRAPKRTEEQRAYDRAVKEQEIRRRNKEKEEAARAMEAEEKAKAAVWDS
ncbi:uncharacterized protein DSM5745_06455 [Aspergillus mulundensis]|uniref:Ubiquitin-like protein smt3 n=1 Tax=Aspergillus mulundensis TaxID=1810919 RepID=A0A3D8RQV9_9EURO|nr:Uncharacterized protein DSM5745_06455 [Aspergillus mulundensis]RDW76463.1 Uncharacterized protein DSM5745_06455 [Aspergillus mulundensis]